MTLIPMWAYQTIVPALLTLIAFLIARYINRQDKKNEGFYIILEKNEQAITRLNTTLELNEKLYDERHENHERRIIKLEEKQK